MSNRKLRVFLCHSSQDKVLAREIYTLLLSEEWIEPWLDEEKLLPGQNWDIEIEKAVESSDAVIVCLSNNAINKEGYIQRELRMVLDIADKKPAGEIFVIPIKLEECQTPNRLREWQYENYFPVERKRNVYQRVLESLKIQANVLKIQTGAKIIKMGDKGINPRSYNNKFRQCKAKTKNGSPCQIPTSEGNKYCHIHSKQKSYRKILSVSAIGAIILGIFGFIANLLGVLGYLGITPETQLPKSTPTKNIIEASPTFTLFNIPEISTIIEDYEIAGYGKQTSLVRDSIGKLTIFIRNDTGNLAFATSLNKGKTWNEPNNFYKNELSGGPQLSASIDSADQIHAVWGSAPEAGNAEYGLLVNDTWVVKEIVGTGVFARDVAVDSANHPHIVWTNLDLFHTTFDGYKWTPPMSIAPGRWHPDIQITKNDDMFIFVNDGAFYPTPGVSVYAIDNINVKWNLVKVSTSPFWSGAAVATLDSQGVVYLVWIGSSSENGGKDEVFFSRLIDNEWQIPFQIGVLNSSAGSTGQESPAIAFDANNIFYVFWRGVNAKNRPVIYARAFATENSNTNVTSGWSPIIELDNRDASNVGWPSIADTWRSYRSTGIDLVWNATIGTKKVIQFSHVTYP